jgi:hypothetical protein
MEINNSNFSIPEKKLSLTTPTLKVKQLQKHNPENIKYPALYGLKTSAIGVLKKINYFARVAN